MLIPINKIIVKDRIRKDFGDLQELADDIKQNGLINPPVINKDYVLLAGERRLRACKLLGWEQIPVTMMDTRDAEHELNVEISENDNRIGFSRSEREAAYTRKVRLELSKQSGPIGPTQHDVEHNVAKELGTSRTNMNREREIVKNKNLLDPSDFADWDEGRLSTNKAYQRLKQKLADQQKEIRVLESREPEVRVERPADYEQLKKKAKEADAWKQDYHRQQEKTGEALRKNLELQEQVKKLQEQTVREQLNNDFVAGALYFIAQCGNFIKDVAGYVWIADKLADLPEKDRTGYVKAAKAVQDWSTALLQTIERDEEYGKPELRRISG